MTEDFLQDEQVKISIDRVKGKSPKYGAWSVDAEAWLPERDKEFRKKIALNVLKDNAEFEKDDDGVPHIVKRVKESYMKVLKEDDEFKKYSLQSLDDEHSKVEDCVGCEYNV